MSIDKKQSQDSGNYCLLANDNLFLLEAFKGGLSPHFDHVQTVVDGKQAVEDVTSRPVNYYKVIILDICMPVMNGIDACLLI